VFEQGRVFLRDKSVVASEVAVAGISQPLRVAGLAYGPADAIQWGESDRPVDFFDVKGDVEALLAARSASFAAATYPAFHPGRCARVEIDGHVCGFIGELHPRWRQAYELPAAPVLFELDLAAVMQQAVPVFESIPRHQSAWRDIAVIAGESVTHDQLVSTARAADAKLIRSVRLFDVYKPAKPTPEIAAGERSMALRLEILDDSATLTDERIEAVKKSAVDALTARLGVRLRG
jgi:phenylalanyl-tRNA synthetase beta chain